MSSDGSVLPSSLLISPWDLISLSELKPHPLAPRPACPTRGIRLGGQGWKHQGPPRDWRRGAQVRTEDNSATHQPLSPPPPPGSVCILQLLVPEPTL